MLLVLQCSPTGQHINFDKLCTPAQLLDHVNCRIKTDILPFAVCAWFPHLLISHVGKTYEKLGKTLLGIFFCHQTNWINNKIVQGWGRKRPSCSTERDILHKFLCNYILRNLSKCSVWWKIIEHVRLGKKYKIHIWKCALVFLHPPG